MTSGLKLMAQPSTSEIAGRPNATHLVAIFGGISACLALLDTIAGDTLTEEDQDDMGAVHDIVFRLATDYGLDRNDIGIAEINAYQAMIGGRGAR